MTAPRQKRRPFIEAQLPSGYASLGIETNHRHALGVKIFDADGELVQEIAKSEFEAGRLPGIKPGTGQLITLAANVDFKLEQFGEDVVSVEVNGQCLKRLPFHVAQLGPGGQPSQ